MAELVQYYGTGRRKSSVARVFLRPGSGDFTVNGKPFATYFVTEEQRIMAKSALVLTETAAPYRQNRAITIGHPRFGSHISQTMWQCGTHRVSSAFWFRGGR